MAESRVFRKAEGITIEGIGRSVQNFLRSSKGLVVQGGKAGEGYVVQAKEDDSWKKVAGMSSAIEVQISDTGSGYIAINGEKTADMNEKRLTLYRRKHLGYIFQQYNLIPNLNIKENVEIGAYLSDNPLDTDEILKTLGLYEHRHKLPNQLSGGQQQRTAIGRAIIKNPDILLCDEPTGALDYKTSKDILKLISDVNKKFGNTVVMVTHNDAIKNMADRVIKLRDGMIRKNYLNENKIAAEDLDW